MVPIRAGKPIPARGAQQDQGRLPRHQREGVPDRGYSRQHLYEIRRNFQVHGAAKLLDRLPRAKGTASGPRRAPDREGDPGSPLKYPSHDAQRVGYELMLRGLEVSSGGVRGVSIRNGL